MNSGSEQKLSMDELLEKNRPAQVVQTAQPPAQELTPPPEMHPTKAEWEYLLSDLCTLGYHAERQTAVLISYCPARSRTLGRRDPAGSVPSEIRASISAAIRRVIGIP